MTLKTPSPSVPRLQGFLDHSPGPQWHFLACSLQLESVLFPIYRQPTASHDGRTSTGGDGFLDEIPHGWDSPGLGDRAG